MWYDRRESGFDIDVYMATSTDDGVTFSPSVRVTAAPFAPVLPTEGGAASFIGDYNGIAATPTVVYPFYQDSRRGEQDVWVARIPGSTIDVPPTSGAPSVAIRATPSPFADATTIRVSPGEGRANSEVRMLSVGGRLVRTLTLQASSVVWDGRDERGREASPGVYFTSLGDGGGAPLRLVKAD